jgi:hypothetical protein
VARRAATVARVGGTLVAVLGRCEKPLSGGRLPEALVAERQAVECERRCDAHGGGSRRARRQVSRVGPWARGRSLGEVAGNLDLDTDP